MQKVMRIKLNVVSSSDLGSVILKIGVYYVQPNEIYIKFGYVQHDLLLVTGFKEKFCNVQ